MASADRPALVRATLRDGVVIPAHPLALDARRRLDERRQRGLTEYYARSGAGGVAVGVHTTQFAIRDPGVALYRPVLELAADALRDRPEIVRVAGVCGRTPQALAEARLAADLGYDLALLSLAGWNDVPVEDLLTHGRAVAEVLPLFGFYLQTAVGGRVLPYAFWRAFADLDRLWAVKIAPFNRYQTLDVVRALADAGRDDVALYTGNDDNIVGDLVTPLPTGADGTGRTAPRYFAGGLLGQWACWTPHAVSLLARVKAARASGIFDVALLAEGAALTDANGAIFDAANEFRGCIPGIHEVLRRDGLLDGIWCLDKHEQLSPGQAGEITRVMRSYPFLVVPPPAAVR